MRKYQVLSVVCVITLVVVLGLQLFLFAIGTKMGVFGIILLTSLIILSVLSIACGKQTLHLRKKHSIYAPLLLIATSFLVFITNMINLGRFLYVVNKDAMVDILLFFMFITAAIAYYIWYWYRNSWWMLIIATNSEIAAFNNIRSMIPEKYILRVRIIHIVVFLLINGFLLYHSWSIYKRLNK